MLSVCMCACVCTCACVSVSMTVTASPCPTHLVSGVRFLRHDLPHISLLQEQVLGLRHQLLLSAP